MIPLKLQVVRKKPRIEIIPMIDVMFFMLVFFMLFSTLKSAQTGVPVDLPKTVNSGKAAQNDIVISINREAQCFFGKQPVGISELTRRVAAEIQKDPQTRVIIKPDAAVPYGELIQVMDALAGVGVDKPLWGVDRQVLGRGMPAAGAGLNQ